MNTGCWAMMAWGVAAFAACGAKVDEAPEAPIAAVQAYLKEQRLYSGPVDGMVSPATEGAVRRYQILHGFRATGLLDGSTLASMLTPAPRPDKLTESDRELLKELQNEPPPVAEQRREPIPPAPPPPVAAPDPTPTKGKRARSAQRPSTQRVKPARISRGPVGD